MAPMNTVLSQNNLGYMNDEILAYYAARARGGTGLNNHRVRFGNRACLTFPYPPICIFFNATHVPGLEELSEHSLFWVKGHHVSSQSDFGRQGHSAHHGHLRRSSANSLPDRPDLDAQSMQEFLTANP